MLRAWANSQWYVYALWCDGAQHCSGLSATTEQDGEMHFQSCVKTVMQVCYADKVPIHFESVLQALPLARSQGPLAFVAMRMALDELASAMSETAAELPPIVSRKLYEVVAVVAMQFRGYIFKVNEPQVCLSPAWR